jgi:hypothetical protein
LRKPPGGTGPRSKPNKQAKIRKHNYRARNRNHNFSKQLVS